MLIGFIFYHCFIIETGKTTAEDTGRVVTVQNTADILIFTDSMVANLQVPGASIFMLNRREGFAQVAKLIKAGRVDVCPYKFIVLFCCKIDLNEGDASFRDNLHAMLRAIELNNPLAFMVLMAPLLTLGDPRNLIRIANYRSGYMSHLAEDLCRVEFSRLGKHLLKPGGVIPDYFDEYGHITKAGLEQISMGLMAKFTCARLQQKYIDVNCQA